MPLGKSMLQLNLEYSAVWVAAPKKGYNGTREGSEENTVLGGTRHWSSFLMRKGNDFWGLLV